MKIDKVFKGITSFLIMLFAVSVAYGQGEQAPDCNCSCQPGDKTLYRFNSYNPFIHEQFHCEYTANDAPNALKAHLYNRGEKVKGFDQDGKLKIKVKKFAKVYFDAYHHWTYLCRGVICSDNPNIDCSMGPGAGRKLIDGGYGAHNN